MGDAKLFAALGAWVGWQGLPTVLLYATLGGLAVAAYLMWRHDSARADRALPFGPFLCAGGWLVWLYRPLLVVSEPQALAVTLSTILLLRDLYPIKNICV